MVHQTKKQRHKIKDNKNIQNKNKSMHFSETWYLNSWTQNNNNNLKIN